jgi:uncharacterized membrane protein affecting hemolysin expression
MNSIAIICIICAALILITLIIATTCSSYYSSENKRKLTSLEETINYKTSEFKKSLEIKEQECSRMTNIIKYLTEKNLSIDANIKKQQL